MPVALFATKRACNERFFRASVLRLSSGAAPQTSEHVVNAASLDNSITFARLRRAVVLTGAKT